MANQIEQSILEFNNLSNNHPSVVKVDKTNT